MPPYRVHHERKPLRLKLGGELPLHDIAYETWGRLDADASNAVFVSAGISASSHVRAGEDNPEPGYWDAMVGPGLAIDTDRFFVFSVNWLGGCFGTTGPASIDPRTGTRYGLSFPIVTMHDLGASAMRLAEALGVRRLHACVGSSLGAMVVLAMAIDFGERAGRIASLSGTAWTRPGALAIRYLQRRCVMLDPRWNGGRYVEGGGGPVDGVSIARQIGFTTYRSMGEWDERFGRGRPPGPPDFAADYDVERYLDHQGLKFAERFDANSYLYLSKAMDLFDVREAMRAIRQPMLVVGVDSDLLMPIEEQKEIADAVPGARFVKLASIYGHDAFLKETALFTPPLKEFLER